ncbi:MAG: phosphotransferase [Bacteroidales bacterium]|nr:phosphotransferase [Bacteroidales bacterium]
MENILKISYQKTFQKTDIQSIEKIKSDGSNRKYFRIWTSEGTLIAAYNEDKKENAAFLAFSSYFQNNGISVATVLGEDLQNCIYFLSDLGDTTLYRHLCDLRKDTGIFPPSMMPLYEQALEKLLNIQTIDIQQFNTNLCYPRAAFDSQSMMWDLNYFKYYFLKLAHIPFDEQLLENDFNTLVAFAAESPSDFWLYRDFQSRNIMLQENKMYFIDYQGCRRGALQYDVATLLYDAKAALPPAVRLQLIDYYINILKKRLPKVAEQFMKYFYIFVIIRIMQAMGSYGYRGLYEKKEHFLQSIPYALENLKWILQNVDLPINIPVLWQIFHQLSQNQNLTKLCEKKLTVEIVSFSYKAGYPIDLSGNGGGFVFDCRCLPNPGQFEKFKKLTGEDKEVIDFLNNENTVNQYFTSISKIIDMAIENYLERQFDHLCISFGCTGGQHRSVYFANRLQQYLEKKYVINIVLTHKMKSFWK